MGQPIQVAQGKSKLVYHPPLDPDPHLRNLQLSRLRRVPTSPPCAPWMLRSLRVRPARVAGRGVFGVWEGVLMKVPSKRIATIVSTVLCAVVVVVAMSEPRYHRSTHFVTGGLTYADLEFAGVRGWILYWEGGTLPALTATPSAEQRQMVLESFPEARSFGWGGPPVDSGSLFDSPKFLPAFIRFGPMQNASVPLVSAVIVFAVMPLHSLSRSIRRRISIIRGRCPACGYDLRGSPDGACSECGAESTDEVSTHT
jgi:hypothetical protein